MYCGRREGHKLEYISRIPVRGDLSAEHATDWFESWEEEEEQYTKYDI